MATAYVVGAVRSPLAHRALSAARPDELLAKLLKGLVARAGVDPLVVEDVVAGCARPIGEQSFDLARMAALAAGFPVEVCGTTVGRLCGSGQEALHVAAHAVMAGQQELVIACGVESMSRVRSGEPGWQAPRSLPGRFDREDPAATAEALARRFGLSRERLDEHALESHRRAVAAQDKGELAREILPIEVVDPAGASETLVVDRDEGPRDGLTLLGLASSDPGRLVTAENSAKDADGAAALLVASEAAVKKHALRPRARIVATAVAGVEPASFGGGVAATRKALERAGLRVSDLDLFEVDESFASVPLAWAKETGASLAQTNVRGGAIALGRPLGASGARLVTTLLHALEDRGARCGLAATSIDLGQGIATILDRRV